MAYALDVRKLRNCMNAFNKNNVEEHWSAFYNLAVKFVERKTVADLTYDFWLDSWWSELKSQNEINLLSWDKLLSLELFNHFSFVVSKT